MSRLTAGFSLAEFEPMKDGILCVGECMMEFAHGADGRYGLAFGGDTFNTAVDAARTGLKAAYAMALGDDPFSDDILHRRL